MNAGTFATQRRLRLVVAAVLLLVWGALGFVSGLTLVALWAGYALGGPGGPDDFARSAIGALVSPIVTVASIVLSALHLAAGIGILNRRRPWLHVGLLVAATGISLAGYAIVDGLVRQPAPDGVDWRFVLSAALSIAVYAFVLWALWTARRGLGARS